MSPHLKNAKGGRLQVEDGLQGLQRLGKRRLGKQLGEPGREEKNNIRFMANQPTPPPTYPPQK